MRPHTPATLRRDHHAVIDVVPSAQPRTPPAPSDRAPQTQPHNDKGTSDYAKGMKKLLIPIQSRGKAEQEPSGGNNATAL